MKLTNAAIAKISYEIKQLDKLFVDSKPLYDIVDIREPDFIKKSASALILHSFYNGIENILQIIQKYFGEKITESNK